MRPGCGPAQARRSSCLCQEYREAISKIVIHAHARQRLPQTRHALALKTGYGIRRGTFFVLLA